MEMEGGVGGSNIDPSHSAEHTNNPAAEPWLLTQILSTLVSLISSYGWLFLFLGLACGFLYNKYKPSIEDWRKKREEEREAALYHKNPDLLLAKEMAIDNARKKLQERYDAQSKEHAEKQRIREEQRKQEKIAAYEAQQKGESGKSLKETQNSTQEKPTIIKKKNNLRPEYNPLLGDGGSCSYRPARRSGRQGG